LILLPFRLLGIVVSGVLDLIWTIVMLPASLLRKLSVRRSDCPHPAMAAAFRSRNQSGCVGVARCAFRNSPA
jgi:hypothetical protein